MRRRSRTRRLLTWVGTVICVLILGPWALSYWWSVGYVGPSWDCQLLAGVVVYHSGISWGCTGWAFGDVPRGLFRDAPLIPAVGRSSVGITACFPLWLPLAVFGVPTGVFWWHAWREDCRIPPGHCQHCGYDLTGNVSGQCPECGTPVPSDGREQAGQG